MASAVQATTCAASLQVAIKQVFTVYRTTIASEGSSFRLFCWMTDKSKAKASEHDRTILKSACQWTGNNVWSTVVYHRVNDDDNNKTIMMMLSMVRRVEMSPAEQAT